MRLDSCSSAAGRPTAWTASAPALLLTLGLACGDAGGTKPVSPEEPGNSGVTESVAFADSSLEAAIREALEKPTGALSEEDLLSLATLTATEAGIVDLSGLDQLRNLAILDLAQNEIADISLVRELTQLSLLDLAGNRVNDVSSLAGLASLQILVLESNMVTDIGPLVELPALSSLGLTGNPLDEPSLNRHLVTLSNRGVDVTFASTEAPDQPADVEGFELLPAIPGRITFSAKPDDRHGNHDVYVLDLVRGILIQITDHADDETEPVWSPDGRRIAFVRGGTRGDVYVAQVDESGTHLAVDLTQGQGDNRNPRWSPNGAKIAWARSTPTTYKNIHVMDMDGANWVQLTSSQWDDVCPTWSPDGQRLAFASKDRGIGNEQLFVIDADGGNVTQLTDDLLPDGNPRRVTISHPEWSRDGTRIVFGWRAWIDNRGIVTRILSIRADGTGVVHHGDGTSPSWLLDGSQLLYAAVNPPSPFRSEPCDIFVQDATGGDAANLTGVLRSSGLLNTQINTDPSWTPSDW